MKFSAFDLHPDLLRAVEDLGYIEATPVQEKTIPLILAGKDVVGLAQTGTGKTAAFVLPILHRLLPGSRGRVRVLIVAPTRELAEQIFTDVGALGHHTDLRCVTVYGGVAYKQQTGRLRKGVEIVVGTPGRLLDLMDRGILEVRGLEVLVLDEADRMLDMGFLPDVRRILRKLPSGRQSMMFSATMPYDIRRLAGEIMREPVTIEIGRQAPVETVSHALFAVREPHKTELLLALLRSVHMESVLIFTKTKHAARHVGLALENEGFSVSIIEGDMQQSQRRASLDGFRSSETQILVATDLAARGLDISQISHVINYDMPSTVDDYTHRIGRTGRASRLGEAFTLVTHEDLDMVVGIERVLQTKLEFRLLEGFPHPPPPWDPSVRTKEPPGQRRPRRPTRPALRRR